MAKGFTVKAKAPTKKHPNGIFLQSKKDGKERL